MTEARERADNEVLIFACPDCTKRNNQLGSTVSELGTWKGFCIYCHNTHDDLLALMVDKKLKMLLQARVKGIVNDRTTVTIEENDLIWQDLTISHAVHHLLKWSEE